MTYPTFPTLSDEPRRQLLEPPSGKVRVLIDSDMHNEIDDQFALAWALLSQDQLDIEGVCAEPYSFLYRLDELRRAYDTQQNPSQATDEDKAILARYQGQLDHVLANGTNPHDIIMDTPEEGVEKSYHEIIKVYDKLGLDSTGKAFRGSPRYLTSYDEPVQSDSAEFIIERALAGSSDGPLYIVAIGCVTNVASAMLMAPEIIDRIVVTWTAGYPTNVKQINYSFNLEQDMLASQLLFSSGVPLVYLPGFHIGAQLRLSLPEMETYVKGKGAMGDYLHHLYLNNPLYEFLGIGDHFGRTWVIWDLINIAWLLNPAWVPSQLIPSPTLGDDRRWHHDQANPHLIREAYGIDRDAIFRNFFSKLEQAP